MKASNPLWRNQEASGPNADLQREVDIFSSEIDLRKQGKMDEKVFAETRLRRGAYGQRYDNAQRHDGTKTQSLSFPTDLTKGPETAWDAPGMMRIKIPFGGMTAEQLEVMADLAEEYSDNIAHVTTRQDFQLHFIHIEDTPAIMRRLASVGITTREACGNSVRNVTACPIAGVCGDESFDVTPYAKALTYHFLGHDDIQDFGRKFKIAFSGCKQHACGLTNFHDLGLIARTKQSGNETIRGFEYYVGGGLGAVPHQAKLFEEFITEEELLPITQATFRVFARLGEKKNRAKARIKFLIAKLGIEEFRKLVQEERQQIADNPYWKEYVKEIRAYREEPKRPAGQLNGNRPDGFDSFFRWNTSAQKQNGYRVVTVRLPLGDLTGRQLRALADIAREYVGDAIRLTVEQNIVLRWVSEADLPAVYAKLREAGIGAAGAESIADVTSCPGTDTCKLGISASRGLAGELHKRFENDQFELDDITRELKIKISGCFNSCGQHHVADLGFYGVSRKIGGNTVPHFQVVLGGQWSNNGGAYGLPIVAIPSKNIPKVIERMTGRYRQERQGSESFQAFMKRVGKVSIKESLMDLTEVPAYETDRSFYSDWGDPREYTIGDMGIGECAGEIVSRADFDLAAAERELFEAQVLLDKGDHLTAANDAYLAMVHGAKALVKLSFLDVPEEADVIIAEFRKRFYDTQLFSDKYAGGKFAHYLFGAHESAGSAYTAEQTHHLIEEAGLFLEACHACYARVGDQPVPVV